MTIDELEKDYFATMLHDAEGRYADEHGEDAPATEGFDERAKEDGNRFIAAFHEAFPDSETDGGSLYIAAFMMMPTSRKRSVSGSRTTTGSR